MHHDLWSRLRIGTRWAGPMCAIVVAGWLAGGVGALHFSHLNVDTSLRQPSICVDRPAWDAGNIESGQQIEARFVLTNTGGRRLILHEATHSCRCVVSSQSGLIIQPGNMATIIAHVDTRDASGSMQFELNYRTNDPQRPLLTFFILAQVRNPWASSSVSGPSSPDSSVASDAR